MKLAGKKFPLKELKKGVMCLALFPGDGAYYRAVIMGAVGFDVQASGVISLVLYTYYTCNLVLYTRAISLVLYTRVHVQSRDVHVCTRVYTCNLVLIYGW